MSVVHVLGILGLSIGFGGVLPRTMIRTVFVRAPTIEATLKEL